MLAIALGEATWTCIRDPSFAAGLPFLARLQADGVRAATRAPQPLEHNTLWATLVTGRSAGAHGVFGHLRRDGCRSFRRVTGTDLAVPPVWRLLEDAGVPVGTFNVTHAGPLEPTKGFMVWGDARTKIHPGLVRPPTLYPRLTERHGRWTMGTGAQTKPEWTSLVPREIEGRTSVLIDLLHTCPWRFALVNFIEVARAQHRFWGDGASTLRSIYAAADRAISAVVASVGPDTLVFVFSECGAGPIRHGVDVNAWLVREGFQQRLRGPVQRLGHAAARAHKRARRFLPRAFDWSRFKMSVRASISTSGVDWARTRAFCPGDTSEIVFNVPAHERDALVQDLSARLLALRDPEGRRVVEDVISRESFGSRWDFAPDLTIVWEDDAYMPIEGFDDGLQVFVDWCPEFLDWTFTGSHRREGMLLASGPGIARADLGSVSIVDLVPTWLELLGVDAPRDLEGSSFAARLLARS